MVSTRTCLHYVFVLSLNLTLFHFTSNHSILFDSILFYFQFLLLTFLFFTFLFQAHVLNHQAGLANAALEEISRDPFTVCDTDLILQLIEESSPEHSPGELTKYHYLTFGWIVEGIVRGVTGESLRDFVSKNIGDKLNISDEFMIGIPSQDQSQSVSQSQTQSVSQSVSVEGSSGDVVGVTSGTAGSVSGSVSNINIGIDVSSRVADLVLGKIVMPSPPSPPTPPAPVVATSATTTTTSDSASDSTSTATDTATTTAPSATQPIESSNNDKITSPDSTTAAVTPTETVTGTEMATEEIRVQSFKKRPPSGPSMLMNPTFFNNPRIRY